MMSIFFKFSDRIFWPDSIFSVFSNVMIALYKYKRLKPLVLKIVLKIESGAMFSGTLRVILSKFHGVQVGDYSYGACMVPGAWPKSVTVGRYVSVGPGVHVFLRNHPLDRLSMHPFFYNSQLKYVPVDNIDDGHLEIGHDAWIGANVIITPKCFRIGVGAVLAAGSIVTKDVPDFAVVAGNPAKILYFRFEQNIINEILESKWWEGSVDELVKDMDMMVEPFVCDDHTSDRSVDQT